MQAKYLNKENALITLAFLVVITVLIIVLKRDKKGGKPPYVDLPNSGSGIPVMWSPDEIVNGIYNSISGFGFGYSLNEELSKFNALTLDQVAAVYNRWSELYLGEGQWPFQWENLHKTISGEFCSPVDIGPLVYCDIRNQALQKIESIVF